MNCSGMVQAIRSELRKRLRTGKPDGRPRTKLRRSNSTYIAHSKRNHEVMKRSCGIRGPPQLFSSSEGATANRYQSLLETLKSHQKVNCFRPFGAFTIYLLPWFQLLAFAVPRLPYFFLVPQLEFGNNRNRGIDWN